MIRASEFQGNKSPVFSASAQADSARFPLFGSLIRARDVIVPVVLVLVAVIGGSGVAFG